RTEVSVVLILRLTVRAEFHPVGRTSGPGVGSTALVGRHVTSQSRGKINSSARFPLRFSSAVCRSLASTGRPETSYFVFAAVLPSAVLPSGGPSSAKSLAALGVEFRLSFAL